MVLDWEKYKEAAVHAVEEGIVLLENRNGVLPLKPGAPLAVYGRIQLHYYKSGTGSGGMVNVPEVTGIPEGLMESGRVDVDQELLRLYREWEKENPYDRGKGWGQEPFSQKEMPVSRETAAQTASRCPSALVVLGRSAGEDHDNQDIPGAWQLSEGEKALLQTVREFHRNMIVLLNTGGLMDMKWVREIRPDSVLYVWQGGMTGGTGIANVLTGKVSPSGKLPDTIAENIEDYPSSGCFGDPQRNFYQEDIYVGYRYFETFCKEKVLYPFGFGLSYTVFSVRTENFSVSDAGITLRVSVKNTGPVSGKEVVQVYVEKPQGNLGNPARELAAFEKTPLLAPGGETLLEFFIPLSGIASYDDHPESPFCFSYVLLCGEYRFFAGSDVRSAGLAGAFPVPETRAVQKLRQLLAPETPFRRLRPAVSADGTVCGMTEEAVPLAAEGENARRARSLPQEIPQTDGGPETLADVLQDAQEFPAFRELAGKAGGGSGPHAKLRSFLAGFSDDDLCCIIRGEGMGSPKVTPGTAAAFGGVSKSLRQKGLPCVCCADGPSGMRLDSGAKAFSLPCGTLLASTFNRALVSELFAYTGIEMRLNRVDLLLGPGMNIHRNPLNGRNFEYFSEDPYLSGHIAAAEIRGLDRSGSMGTLKHFCCNNQEHNRNFADACVSERALREIYLKGFEIAVKEGGARSIMTSYNPVNGIWAASRYDLNTALLREEWGFRGIVMTDWWALAGDCRTGGSRTDFAAMIRAQNDLYMVCPDGETNAPPDDPGGEPQDNARKLLGTERLSRGELQRSAYNILAFLPSTEAFRRLCGKAEKIEALNRPDKEDAFDLTDIHYLDVRERLSVSLEQYDTSRGKEIILALQIHTPGLYRMEITGSAEGDSVSQTPLRIFTQGIPVGTIVWNGSGGAWVKHSREVYTESRYVILRFLFPEDGLRLKDVEIEFLQHKAQVENPGEYMRLI